MMAGNRLIGAGEADPVSIIHAAAKGRVVLVCEHASRILPASLGTLGLSDDALRAHIAWDPGALAVAFLYQGVLHRPVITPEYAEKVIASMHPWKSLSIFYAATAGVLLWLSSLCAGWVQNWVIYRGLPQAIAHHRLINDLLGERRSKALGDWIANNSSGLGGNISIGFLLAFVPASGVLTGLPIDVRHVTLSSASLSIALVSFPREALTWQHVVPPILGVMLIGVFNFGVSTALALFVAVRAQRVKGTVVRALLAYTAWEFKRNPFRFFFPTGEDQPSAPHGHGH